MDLPRKSGQTNEGTATERKTGVSVCAIATSWESVPAVYTYANDSIYPLPQRDLNLLCSKESDSKPYSSHSCLRTFNRVLPGETRYERRNVIAPSMSALMTLVPIWYGGQLPDSLSLLRVRAAAHGSRRRS